MSQPQPPEGEVQRWTAKRKAAVVLDLVRGKIAPADAARQHGLTVAEIEQWKDYGLKQEYITPYTPQQNDLCERFNRSFKEECAWLHRFQDIQEARAEVARYIDHYNHERPHQSLDYRTLHQAFLNPEPTA